MTRPLIALPGRFSQSAAALRFAAVVNARALVEAVYAAGADPATILPTRLSTGREPRRVDPSEPIDQDLVDMLSRFDGILMPGGADLDPRWYGQEPTGEVEPTDTLQDAFDLAVVRHAIASGTPLLTVCRGTQLLNVALGGTLEQDMETAHRHTVERVVPEPLGDEADVDSTHSPAAALPREPFSVSCYHHQRIADLAPGLQVVARAPDGTVEAVRHVDAPGWLLGVQWHPEDTAVDDVVQQNVLRAFVDACRTPPA